MRARAPDPGRLMIMCAPNGARRGKDEHPGIPLTPLELAREAGRLAEVGVSVLHLHVRDDQGGHSIDPGRYREAITAIREQVGDALVIQVTSEAAGVYGPTEQMAMVRALRPEAVSLALAELSPDESNEGDANAFFRWVADAGIWAQYIVYTPGQFARLENLRVSGELGTDRPSCLFVLGSYLEQRSGTVEELQDFLDTADTNHFDWAACCFGPTEQATLAKAVEWGGHVRLGFENNLWLPDGKRATDNAELVRAFRTVLPDPSPKLMPAAEVRSAFV